MLISQTIASQPLAQLFNQGIRTPSLSPESPSFTQLLQQTGLNAMHTLKHADALSKQAAQNPNMDSQAVALGVLNASSSTRQLTGIISAGLQSYKEIQHMQI